MANNKEVTCMSETYNRSDRLYALARGCQINNLTPNHTNYIGFILHFATSKLSMSKETARSYAEDLKTAYDADQWQTILSGSEIETPAPSTTPQSEAETPSLNAYKTFTLTGPTEPIRHIAPKQVVETEDTPRTTAQILINLAHQNMWDGKGRITLAEARYELGDKTLLLKDIEALVNQYFPAVHIETRPGNLLLLYFNTKRAVRAVNIIIPELAPVFAASKSEYFLEAPLEKDAEVYDEAEADIADE
jgi:hypothetical protein